MIIVCDIDGVVADNSHRLKHLEADPVTGKKNWKAYYDALPEDQLIGVVGQVLEQLAGFSDERNKLIFATGRPEAHRKATKRLLDQMDVRYEEILMRPDDDFSTNPELKREWIRHIEEKYGSIDLVFEDDPRSVAMWREHATIVFEVHHKNPLTEKENSVEYTV